MEKIDHFVPITNKHIPYHKIRKEPWVSFGLLVSMKKEKRLYKNTLGKHASNEALEKYQNYNCVLKKVKRHAKRNYYINKCNEFKKNTKKLWQTINHVVGKAPDKSCSIKYLSIAGCKVHDATKVTNHLNHHFANVGESFAKMNPQIKSQLEILSFKNQEE